MRRYGVLSVGPAVVLLAAALSACGSDDPDFPSNRGSGADAAETSVENAYVVPAFVENCAIQVNAPADLSFTVTNNSSTESETLIGISTPVAGSVEIHASDEARTISPGATIAAGQPVENLDAPEAPDEPFTVSLVDLGPKVTPGASFPMTFTFERAGDITLNVGVDACPAQAK